jgi:hypothetical protein
LTSIAVWDPGVTSGLVRAWFTKDAPVEILSKSEIPGGLEGICDVLWNGVGVGTNEEDVWVCERFRMTPLVRTSVQVQPLRIEGAIALAHGNVVWQYPDSMLLAGSHHGSPSNHKDANDINSAMKHLVAYLRNIDHQPTLEALGVT